MEAKELVTTEMNRLIQDPITGGINKNKVINIKERIESSHLIESENYKQAEAKLLKTTKFNKKYGIEEATSAGRELQKINECKKLLKKMNGLFKKHEAYKPSLVQQIRDYKITYDPSQIPQQHYNADSEVATKTEFFKKKLSQSHANLLMPPDIDRSATLFNVPLDNKFTVEGNLDSLTVKVTKAKLAEAKRNIRSIERLFANEKKRGKSTLAIPTKKQ